MTDISQYIPYREDAERLYQKVGKIPCPAFENDLVYFSAEGFNHLVYKDSRTERLKQDQITKFKQLDRAVELVRLTTTYQEYEERLLDVWVKRHKKRAQETKLVRYWGLIAIIRRSKIKVIVRQIGDGQKHFWSVIPNWTTNQYRDVTFVSHMKGNPEDN
jgi:hypothetical protein